MFTECFSSLLYLLRSELLLLLTTKAFQLLYTYAAKK